MTFRPAAFFSLLCAVLLAQGSKPLSVPHQRYSDDELVLYAKSIDVAKLDSTLSSRPLEEWLLRGPARIDEVYWRVKIDCDLKDPEPDTSGDYPLCVKIGF